jgi:hypothetical protein
MALALHSLGKWLYSLPCSSEISVLVVFHWASAYLKTAAEVARCCLGNDPSLVLRAFQLSYMNQSCWVLLHC